MIAVIPSKCFSLHCAGEYYRAVRKYATVCSSVAQSKGIAPAIECILSGTSINGFIKLMTPSIFQASISNARFNVS